MDKRQRMMLLGIAAVIAAVAVAVAIASSGGDDDDTTTTTQATETRTQGGPPGATAPQEPDTTETQPAEPEVTEIRVKGGKPVGGVQDVEAKSGEDVRIEVTADEADEAHLHGYDIEKELEPGKAARFSFEADIEGVFELELHHSGAQLAKITVKP